MIFIYCNDNTKLCYTYKCISDIWSTDMINGHFFLQDAICVSLYNHICIIIYTHYRQRTYHRWVCRSKFDKIMNGIHVSCTMLVYFFLFFHLTVKCLGLSFQAGCMYFEWSKQLSVNKKCDAEVTPLLCWIEILFTTMTQRVQSISSSRHGHKNLLSVNLQNLCCLIIVLSFEMSVYFTEKTTRRLL